MIEREITASIKKSSTIYPVVSLTGPRQSGKSTLLQNAFKDYTYLNLEDIGTREYAIDDPKGFLTRYENKVIIDEAQYVPDLFSYIQLAVDKINTPGRYILSGSQNFLLSKNISQSLAGRVGINKLLPLSYNEINSAKKYLSAEELVFTGSYPRIYSANIPPEIFYPDYIETYANKDINLLMKIRDLSTFNRFLGLCAARVGQILNVASLANDCGIKVDTAKAWLSLLEASYIVYLIPPYYSNIGKRLIKSPKLYFYDTGLAASLLKLTTIEAVSESHFYGSLFENYVFNEFVKGYYNKKINPSLYFYRDTNGNEVDLIDASTSELKLFEIKFGKTGKKEFANLINSVGNLLQTKHRNIIYAGSENLRISEVNYIPWNEISNQFI